MKNPPALANDPFRRADPVAAVAMDSSLDTREGRIAILAWVADELIASSDPRKKFVGSALKAGLEEGKHVGDLERKFLGSRVGKDAPLPRRRFFDAFAARDLSSRKRAFRDTPVS